MRPNGEGSLPRVASAREAHDPNERRWFRAGLGDLTGRAGERGLGPPPGVVQRIDRVADRFWSATGVRLVEPLELLGERARHFGFGRHGHISCGGSTRLLKTADGWLALSVSRADDVGLFAAWLGLTNEPVPSGFPLDHHDWERLGALVANHRTADLEEQGALLGLAVGALAHTRTGNDPEHSSASGWRLPIEARGIGDAPARSLASANVLDLSSLWAGPLSTRLAGLAGALVTKVESTSRPDSTIAANRAFDDALNGSKERVAFDFTRPSGRRALASLIDAADVVVSSSRPRALRQLGFDIDVCVRSGPQVWVAITGYGLDSPGAGRVGFGDDVAVAAGLVVRDPTTAEPLFCADAIADPITGLVSAAAMAHALNQGGRWVLDVAMVRASRFVAAEALATQSSNTTRPRT